MVGNLLHLWLVFVTCTVCITFMVDFYYISITFMDDYYIYGWQRLSVQWNSVAQLFWLQYLRAKLKFSFLPSLASCPLKQTWKTHWPRKRQYRVMGQKTVSADLHVSYKGRITVYKHLEDLLDTPVYHSPIFDRQRFKFCPRKLLWGSEYTTQSTNKQVLLSRRTSESR